MLSAADPNYKNFKLTKALPARVCAHPTPVEAALPISAWVLTFGEHGLLTGQLLQHLCKVEQRSGVNHFLRPGSPNCLHLQAISKLSCPRMRAPPKSRCALWEASNLGCPGEPISALAHADVEHQLLHPDLPVAVGGLLLRNLQTTRTQISVMSTCPYAFVSALEATLPYNTWASTAPTGFHADSSPIHAPWWTRRQALLPRVQWKEDEASRRSFPCTLLPPCFAKPSPTACRYR